MFRAQQNAFDDAVGEFNSLENSMQSTDRRVSESNGREPHIGELGIHIGMEESQLPFKYETIWS